LLRHQKILISVLKQLLCVFVPLIISAALTTGLVAVLNTPLSVGKTKTPRLGYFLSPQQGFWQNART